jgi:hypothetical protein
VHEAALSASSCQVVTAHDYPGPNVSTPIGAFVHG